MSSRIFDQISFYVFLLIAFLLPVFFLPFTKIPIETSKGLVVVLGLSVSLTAWALARFFDGKVLLPKSNLLLAGGGVLFAFFISALASPVKAWSFWGIMFDVGSFWFMFACFMLMFLASVIINDKFRSRLVLGVVMSSFVFVLLFQLAHLIWPAQTSFGVLAQKADTLVGSWNVLGMLSGLIVIAFVFAVEFLLKERWNKVLAGLFLLLGYFFVLLVNYSFVLWLVGIFTLVIFVFKFLEYTKSKALSLGQVSFPLVPLVIFIFSALFLVSGSEIRGFLPNSLGVAQNVEIRAPFGSTVHIIKQTLKDRPALGSGPNRFGDMWSLHKNPEVNTGGLWDISFDFGWGLMPTFIVTTGILGTLAWLVFFAILILQGLKIVFFSIREGKNYELSLLFFTGAYLFLASVFHPFGSTLFFLAFLLVGSMVGVFAAEGDSSSIKLSFLDDPRKSFFAIMLLIVFIIISVWTGISFTKRFASVPYFKTALAQTDTTKAEESILRAISLNPNDLYYRTLAQIQVAKLREKVLANRNPSEAEGLEMKKILDNALDASIASTDYNHTNFLNYLGLGIVYEFAGSLGAPGHYDKAFLAYESASRINPLNPGIKLAMARVSLANKNKVEAMSYAEESLRLKPDYFDVLVFLAQFSKNEGDLAGARGYATSALMLAPSNKQLLDFLENLKPVEKAPVKEEPKKKNN